MKKLLSLSVAAAMVISLCACGSEAKSSESSSSSSKADSSSSAVELTPAQQLLEDVKGTYDELFTVICDDKYDQVWLSYSGWEKITVDSLTHFMTSQLLGLFVGGCLYQFMKEKTRTIWIPVLVHGFLDYTSILLYK